MLYLSALLFLGASIGNAALWVFCINYLYGTRFRGWCVRLIKRCFELAIVGGPLAFLYRWGEELATGGDWLALPWPLLAYLPLCWWLGFIVFPYVTVVRSRRQTPLQEIGCEVEVLDVARALGRRPYGDGKRRWLARLPFNQLFEVELVERVFRMPQLPRAWDGLTILHVTDLHLCGTPDRDFYEHVLERFPTEPTDLVALTGDTIDSDRHYRWIMRVLTRLRWKAAAFAIFGNHDAEYDLAKIRRRVERVGIEMIGGRWKQLDVRGEPLIVVGHEMPWVRPAPDLRDCPEAGFRLCLSHTPDLLPWARANRIDLMLAGHNHGGQIRLPVVGPIMVPSKFSRRYDQGVFYEDPTLLHVGKGLGGTYPIRWNCRPDVTRITLRAAQLDHDAADPQKTVQL